MTWLKEIIKWLCLWIADKMGDINITLPTPAPPAIPGEDAIVAGTNLVATLAKAGTTVYANENDKAHEDAAIEQHAQAAIDKLNAAIKTKDLDTIRKMAQPVMVALFAFLSWTLTACSSFHPFADTPTWSDPATAYFDNTTPVQYGSGFDSGVLDEVQGKDGLVLVITRDRAAKEKALGHSVSPYKDKYGNHVFTIDVSVITAEYRSKQDATVKRLEGAK